MSNPTTTRKSDKDVTNATIKRSLRFVVEIGIIAIVSFFVYGFALPVMYNMSDTLVVAVGLIAFLTYSAGLVYVMYNRIHALYTYFEETYI